MAKKKTRKRKKVHRVKVNIAIDHECTDDYERGDALEEIGRAIDGLVQQAETLLIGAKNRLAYDRARAYWLSAMDSALGRGETHATSLDETVSELRGEDEEDWEAA